MANGRANLDDRGLASHSTTKVDMVVHAVWWRAVDVVELWCSSGSTSSQIRFLNSAGKRSNGMSRLARERSSSVVGGSLSKTSVHPGVRMKGKDFTLSPATTSSELSRRVCTMWFVCRKAKIPKVSCRQQSARTSHMRFTLRASVHEKRHDHLASPGMNTLSYNRPGPLRRRANFADSSTISEQHPQAAGFYEISPREGSNSTLTSSPTTHPPL
jgi:hypothetical protein